MGFLYFLFFRIRIGFETREFIIFIGIEFEFECGQKKRKGLPYECPFHFYLFVSFVEFMTLELYITFVLTLNSTHIDTGSSVLQGHPLTHPQILFYYIDANKQIHTRCLTKH